MHLSGFLESDRNSIALNCEYVTEGTEFLIICNNHHEDITQLIYVLLQHCINQ